MAAELATPGGRREATNINAVSLEIPEAGRIEYQGVAGRGSNATADTKENPGSAGGATGAKLHTWTVWAIDTLNRVDAASAFPILTMHWGALA